MMCAIASISSSWASAAFIAAGASVRWRTISRSSSSLIAPLSRATLAASAASTASWQVKALVEATPISGPAWVGRSRSASRAIELVGTLTTTAIFCPWARAWRSAASVSAVSPDWLMNEREPARLEHRVAVAELRGDIELAGHAGEALEPIFGDHAGIIRGAAGDDGDSRHRREGEIHVGQRHLLLERAEIGAERLGDDERLLENLLLHEMAVIALFDARRAGARFDRSRGSTGWLARSKIADLVMGDDRPVAFVEIGDPRVRAASASASEPR